jgi:uncharacterized UBP type Zn finger protein
MKTKSNENNTNITSLINPNYLNEQMNNENNKEIKGLLNPLGHHNCFLNVVIQVLWQLDSFRDFFLNLDDKKHIHLVQNKLDCLYCSLKILLLNYKFNENSILPPMIVRKSLSAAFNNKRFKLNEMDDAGEAFVNIFI